MSPDEVLFFDLVFPSMHNIFLFHCIILFGLKYENIYVYLISSFWYKIISVLFKTFFEFLEWVC